MGIKSSKSTTKPIYSKQIEGAANSVQGVYDANAGGIADMSSNLQGRIPGLLERAFGQNQNLDASEGYAKRVVNGEFLNNNPYVDEMSRVARDNAGDSINSYFGRMGRVGGGAHMEDLGRGMAEAELGMRAGVYGNERSMQQQAAFAMPGLTEARYQGVPYALQASGAAADLPFTGTRNLASGVGGLLGQYTKTKQKQALGPMLLQAAGNAASAYAGGM